VGAIVEIGLEGEVDLFLFVEELARGIPAIGKIDNDDFVALLLLAEVAASALQRVKRPDQGTDHEYQ
jgi:hypothetical protein